MGRSGLRVPAGLVEPDMKTAAPSTLLGMTRLVRQSADVDLLAADMAANGNVMYAAALQSGALVGGERRVRAAVSLGWEAVTVYVITNWDQFVWWMDQDARSWDEVTGDTGDMMNLVEGYAFASRAIAALSPGRHARPDWTISTYLGYSEAEIQEMRTVRKWTTNGDPEVVAYANEQILEIGRGLLRPSSAHARIKRLVDKKLAPRQSVEKQVSILSPSTASLSGIARALGDLGPINPEMSAEQRDQYLTALRDARSAIERVQRSLRAVEPTDG